MGLNLLGLIPFFVFHTVVNIVPPPREHAGIRTIFKIMLAAPSIIACGIVFGALEQGMFHILPVYGTRLLGSEHLARLLLLVATVGNAVFQYPMGMLVDRVDRQKLMISLMSCAFIGPLLMIWAGTNFIALAIIAFFYVGLTTALYTVGLVLLAQRFRGHMMAAANAAFIFAYGIGSLVVPPIAGFMMDVIQPYGFLWTMAGLGAFGFIIIAVRRQRINPAFDAS